MGNKIYLSPSTLNIYRECPKCFYLHIHYGIQRPRGPMPSITIGLDSIIKKYFEFYRNIGQLPPFLEDKIEGKLITILEKTYYYDINNKYCIFGKLDEAIALNDGTFVPLDHKTRASAPDKVHEAYQLQMSVYTLLLRQNNKKVSNFAYLVYYYPEESKIHNGISFGFKVEKVETDPDEVIKYINEAIECLESPKIPPGGKNCEYCKWVNQIKEYYFFDEVPRIEKHKKLPKIEKEENTETKKYIAENKEKEEDKKKLEENFEKGFLF
ncbi:MAG TPA: PD-(D/E)XK nuclease family protein [Candidatus Ratteibacteria bacterium]|nr:PD-(D/E)XK nuclease family protein [Candidatus Ratteibacteria bacterium]